MIAQIRGVLDKYQANGGKYQEVVLPECGHAPHLEKAADVTKMLVEFFNAH